MSRLSSSLACLALAACASTSPSFDQQPRPARLGSHDVVAFDELRRYDDGGSLFDFLSRVRPQMLRPRLGTGVMRGVPEGIDVFVNGHFAGNDDVLRTLLPSHVASVRMVQRTQAFVEYGGRLRGEHALFVTLVR